GEHRDDGDVALPGRRVVDLRRGEQRVHLIRAEPDGGRMVASNPRPIRTADRVGGDGVDLRQVAVPAGESRELASDRGRAQRHAGTWIYCGLEVASVRVDVDERRGKRVELAVRTPRQPSVDVAPVRHSRVIREPAVAQPAIGERVQRGERRRQVSAGHHGDRLGAGREDGRARHNGSRYRDPSSRATWPALETRAAQSWHPALRLKPVRSRSWRDGASRTARRVAAGADSCGGSSSMTATPTGPGTRLRYP